ncbi:MAG: DUF2339 domain-containing protein [Oscillospiraceae bacterium]|nr:DUF2339 domain-containing protein [Oscillospiraceae bacterium]
MSNIGNINAVKTALDALKESQAKVEAAFTAFEEQDISKENTRLREVSERLSIQLRESRDETASLRGAYDELMRNFKHEMSAKRLSMIGISERKHMEYLNAGLSRERVRIEQLHNELQKNMNGMSAELARIDESERRPLFEELSDLHRRITEQSQRARARKEAAWYNAAAGHAESFKELTNSPAEDAAVSAARKFFAWEAFLGLKLISIIGALLLLLGVFTFGRYLYVNMGSVLQCASIFVFGLLLMGVGEIFYRKKWRGGFALALTAGGSGTLFLGAALGYMTLEVLPMWAALGICAGASLLSFVASLRYNAQLIAVFALIGGYLPIIALEGSIVFFGAIYFTVLSLLSLLIATRKNWRIARFVGLFAGMTAGLGMMNVSWGTNADAKTLVAVGAGIAVNFTAFIIIPVLGAWFTKTHIKAADIVLLSFNVFYQFLLAMYWGTLYVPSLNLFSEWNNYTQVVSALISAFFAVCCITMALIAERQKHSGVPESETGSIRALFFITSVAFTALVVLFALDRAWFSAGWLVQAAGLSLYGIINNRRRFNIAGLIIGAFCLLSFLLFNVSDYNEPVFVWQYLSITITAAIVSAVTLRHKPKHMGVRVWLNIFRFAAAFNIWGYLSYVLYNPLMPALSRWVGKQEYNFAALICITLGFMIAFILPRIRKLYNRGYQTAAMALGTVNTMWLLSFNSGANGLADNTAVSIVAFALYIAVNITAIGWISDLLRFLSGLSVLPLRWFPLLLSGFTVLMAAQNLVVQLSLEASSLILTLLFGLTAFGWVVFGFVKRNNITRISGLAMAFFAVFKLLVLDLYGLETTWRIVSFITGGVVLLAISFIYQWFNRRLEKSIKESDRNSYPSANNNLT